ncbi:hypothetical protein ABZP36_006345 [Zizania latifolia]
MYSPPCTAAVNNQGHCFAVGANQVAPLDPAMDLDEAILFPMHNAGLQEGIQLYNPTGAITIFHVPTLPDTQTRRNMSIDKCLKGSKRKGSGESSSSLHSQEETGEMAPREIVMEHVGEKSGDAGTSREEEYVHVRAKRGQATNNHSLAERFRREKINERMKLLQDLVPGCNKITGKAMMLDEIINYVQSLQRQVEFLSMKLSAISPELNSDLDLQDILCSQDVRSAFLGCSPRLSNAHPNLYKASQQGFSCPGLFGNVSIPNPTDVHTARTAQLAVFSQQRGLIWDEELLSIAPAAFASDAAGTSSLDNSGRKGCTCFLWAVNEFGGVVEENSVKFSINGVLVLTFLWILKRLPEPVASTINTLAGALYKVFSASPDQARNEMRRRQACFDYLSLGGVFSNGPIALLSGLNPRPLSLVAHFFAVAIYGVGRLMLPLPSPKRVWICARLISVSLSIFLFFQLFPSWYDSAFMNGSIEDFLVPCSCSRSSKLKA